MTGLSLKSAALCLAILFFLGGSALANSFTFTGTASFGNDAMNFFLSGPSFSINSASPSGPVGVLATCLQGTLCTIPDQFIPTTPSSFSAPGDFSGGIVRGVTADTLLFTGLDFSSFSFTPGTNPNGSGTVTFTGFLTGFVFHPLGCEKTRNCTAVGPQVFDLFVSGTGTGTAFGQDIGDGEYGYTQFNYTFQGTATGNVTPVVPEPSSLLLVSSGLAGVAAIRRWHLLRRVNR